MCVKPSFSRYNCVTALLISNWEEKDLDVGVHIHKSPLAVLTIDAERHPHLFVQQDANFDSLLLQKQVQIKWCYFFLKKVI